VDSPEIGEEFGRRAGPSTARPAASRGRRDRSAPPDFQSRVAASIRCMWFSLRRTTRKRISYDRSLFGGEGDVDL
jgi:hypothetical protein